MDRRACGRDARAAVHLLELSIDHARFPTRDAYPFSLRVVQETARLALDAPVTFFAGENGSGKSTLLRALAHRCGIHIWEDSERTSASRNPFTERLYECIDVRWTDGSMPGSFFAAEIFRNFAELVDAWAASDPGLLAYFGGSSLTEKSHGQCNMAFFESRFRIPGLYLLDEPESALSPRRQLELLRIIAEASGRGDAQFIVATHSPLLMSLPGSRILSFDSCPVAEIAYRDTDSFRLHREFFEKTAPLRGCLKSTSGPERRQMEKLDSPLPSEGEGQG
jgi:predicted ATPase